MSERPVGDSLPAHEFRTSLEDMPALRPLPGLTPRPRDPNRRVISRSCALRLRNRCALAALAICGLAILGACGSDASRAPNPASSPQPATAPASAAPTPTTSALPQRRFRGVEAAVVATGFATPWDLRLLPDGTALVTERRGLLSAVVDGRRRVVARVPGVVARGEGGLMGLALDPQFEATGHVYLCYAAGSGDRVSDVRVVRFRLTDRLDALTDATPLVTGIPAGAGNRHLGCRVGFGPDGMLWITTGDAVQPRAPQNPTSLAGKVLRARPDGRPAPGNAGGPADAYVYTTGHRNIQGLSFRASDGAALTVEHGTDCDDEVNLLQRGGNYGWDPVGPGGTYAEGAPMTSPDIGSALPAVWSSGCPTIAPSGSDFVAGDGWGRWDGALAVAVLKDRQLLFLDLDGDTVAGTRAFLTDELGRLRTVRAATDGSLWVTVDADPGVVVRVVPR